jgi:hypothetical protein
MRSVTAFVAGAALLILTTTGSAAAQTDHGPLVSGIVSATAVNGETSPSFSGFAGYRFNRAFGLGVEITSIRSVEPRFGDDPIVYAPLTGASTLIYPYPYPRFSDLDGTITVFTTNARLEIPTVSRRVTPFAIAGGGIANQSYRYTLSYDPRILAVAGAAAPTGLTIPSRAISSSVVHMVMTLGGGVSLLWTDHLAIDIEARVVALRGNGDGELGRFGVGASYRF